MKMPLRFVLSQIFHIQNKRLRPFISQAGMSSGQPKVLDYLSFNEGCTQKEIAHGCGVEPATMSGIINGLIKKGYIRKEISEKNRREFHVFLTESGRSKHSEIRKVIDHLEQQTLSCFTEEEKIAFQSYLERYYEMLLISFQEKKRVEGE